jgi:probable rRNA maturation factor
LDYPDAELSILIVDDQQIARLNQQYLNRQGPTNVIAFAMQDGPFTEIAPDLLGDVVISVETAHREAKNAGIGTATYVVQLLIHGILHLLGYDHENDTYRAHKMEQKANEIFDFIKSQPAPE